MVSRDKKSWLIAYSVCFCIAISLAFVALLVQGFFADSVKENMKILHNAFFVSGGLLTLFSGLLYVSDGGAFLGVGYVLGRAVKGLFPFWGKDAETYAEYRERKIERKKAGFGKLPLLLTGIFFLLLSLIFLAVWYQV